MFLINIPANVWVILASRCVLASVGFYNTVPWLHNWCCRFFALNIFELNLFLDRKTPYPWERSTSWALLLRQPRKRQDRKEIVVYSCWTCPILTHDSNHNQKHNLTKRAPNFIGSKMFFAKNQILNHVLGYYHRCVFSKRCWSSRRRRFALPRG